MKNITTYLLEAKKAEPIDWSQYDSDIKKDHKDFKLMVAADGGDEHVYLKDLNSKRFYDEIDSKKMNISYFDLNRLAKTSLGKVLWVAVQTFEAPNTTSRIRGINRHYVIPVVTSQGMFFNNDKECKQFIRSVKNEPGVRPGWEGVKSYKMQPATLEQYVEICDKNANGGEFHSWDNGYLKFAKNKNINNERY